MDTIKIEDLVHSDSERNSEMSLVGGGEDEIPGMSAEENAPQTQNSIVLHPKNYDDEPDETLAERLWALKEMVPVTVRNRTTKVAKFMISTMKTVFDFTCNATWLFFSTSTILFAPIIFDIECRHYIAASQNRNNQALLGPGTAIDKTDGSQAVPQNQ